MTSLAALTSRLSLTSLRRSITSSSAIFCKPSVSSSSGQLISNRMIGTTSQLAFPSGSSHHRPRYTQIGGAGKIVDGTEDPNPLLSVDTKNVDRFLPTVETMKKLFDGIPYEDLPIVHIKASKNNTIITVTDSKYQHVTYTSCKREGFKNARKKTTIAGQTVGVAAGQRMLRRGIKTVRVKVRGLGPGRLSSVKGLTVAGVNVVSITDFTALPELGPRPKAKRSI